MIIAENVTVKGGLRADHAITIEGENRVNIIKIHRPDKIGDNFDDLNMQLFHLFLIPRLTASDISNIIFLLCMTSINSIM